jgi:thioredoxin 1
MASANIVNVTSQTFAKEVLESSVPVMVDFWAAWCGPCKMIAPALDELADEYVGKARIVKVDVDSEQLLAGQFNVRSIPTLLLFKQGQVVEQIVGARGKNDFKASIDRAIAK